MSSPIDWGQIYQQNPSNQLLLNPNDHPGLSGSILGERVSDATITTTVPAAATNPSCGHLSPDGRVTKPPRRRSRASRRTPTTLLNTDTTNFRAMVQQFTGGPSLNAPFASQLNATPTGTLSFGLDPPRQGIVPSLGYHNILNYQQQEQQRQQPYNMFSLGTTSTTATTSMDGSGLGFFIDGHGSHGPSSTSITTTPRPPPSSSSDQNNNNNNSFFF